MSRKSKILMFTYLTAAFLALGFFALAGQYSLHSHARAARYSSLRAFEETVAAVDRLSQSLAKSPYAYEGGMKSRLCGEIYASSLAAEAAMSTLPFSTQELEQLSAFLNRTGDYAYTLSGQDSDSGFAMEDAHALEGLSAQAAAFLETLQRLRGELAGGELRMDALPTSPANVEAVESPLLSSSLLDYEQGLTQPELPDYDGQYSREEQPAAGELGEEEMLRLAAEYAGVSPGSLRSEFAYEGEEGRRCYSVGDLLVCVGPAGVESMSSSRLVSQRKLSLEQAEQLAQQWLQEHQLGPLQLTQARENGAVALLDYAALTEDGVVYPENRVQLAVAMDDGSLYGFHAGEYRKEMPSLEWALSMQEAESRLPGNLQIQDCRRLIRQSPGGTALAVYELDCVDRAGRELSLILDGKTGEQLEILIH